MEQENLQNIPEETAPVKSNVAGLFASKFNGVKKPIYIIVLILLILAIGYYLYINFYKTEVPRVDNSSADVSTTDTSQGDMADTKIGEVFLQEGQSYEYVGADKELIKNTPIPDLNRNIPSGVSEDIKKNITFLSNELKVNSGIFDSWIDLGSYRKSAGDYEGAKLAWEYASILRPRFSLSFLNIGNLFGYYLKDFKKAESNFLKAIEVEPTQTYAYISTANFYIEVMNDKNKAIEIIKKGIENNPKAGELKTILSEIQ